MSVKFPIEPATITKFGQGLITKLEPNKLPLGAALETKNTVFDSDGGIGPRGGYTIFGDTTAGSGKILSAKAWLRRGGDEKIVRLLDTGSAVTLQFFDSLNSTWSFLKGSLTTGKRASIVDFSSSAADRLAIINGTDAPIQWIGNTTNLNGALSGGEGTITVDSTSGFGTTGTLTIGTTVNVTYTGKTSVTFTGCSNTPAASDNASVTDSVTNPSLTNVSNLGRIAVAGQARMWDGGYDSTGTTVVVSKINDWTNYSYSTPRVPGEGGLEDFIEGGGAVTSLYMKDGQLVVFKQNSIILYELQQQNVSTDEFPVRKVLINGPDVGAISHWATVGAYNDIFFVSKKGGIRRLSRVSNTDLAVFDSTDLSDNIRPTIADYDFTDAVAIFFDQKYLLSCKATSDASYNNRVLMYDYRTGGWSIWYMNVNDWFIYAGNLYFASSSSRNTYKMFDGYEDTAGIAIQSEFRTGYIDSSVGHLEEMTAIYAEGSIATGTTMDYYINYNDGGRTLQVHKTINGSISNPYILTGSAPSFGTYSFGTTPFGGGLFAGATDMNKFRVYFAVPKSIRFHNFDIALGSNQAGGRWKLVNLALWTKPIENIPKNLFV